MTIWYTRILTNGDNDQQEKEINHHQEYISLIITQSIRIDQLGHKSTTISNEKLKERKKTKCFMQRFILMNRKNCMKSIIR